MKIKSMTATFGGLKNAKLTPGPGLTLIHAPNEGGQVHMGRLLAGHAVRH